MKIITKADKGKSIEVQLHEFFAVEVSATHPDNEFLAVPAFIEAQNFEIIREYAFVPSPQAAHGITSSHKNKIGKKVFLLLATNISEVDLSWYNLATAKKELSFSLNVSAYNHDSHDNQWGAAVHHASDNNHFGLPRGVAR